MSLPLRTATLDVGNTQTKGIVWSGALVAERFGAPTARLSDLAAARPDPSVTAAALASVVPERTGEALGVLARRFPNAHVRTVQASEVGLLDVTYRTPATLGADRIAAAVGARQRYPDAPALIVVDAGTAVTYEVVVGRSYLGGAIAPGPDLQLAALAQGTAQLPAVPLGARPTGIGRDTSEAIAAGVWWSFVGGVAHTLGRIRREIEAPPRVVLTGGWAEALSRHTDADAVAPDLVHEGLRALLATPGQAGAERSSSV